MKKPKRCVYGLTATSCIPQQKIYWIIFYSMLLNKVKPLIFPVCWNIASLKKMYTKVIPLRGAKILLL